MASTQNIRRLIALALLATVAVAGAAEAPSAEVAKEKAKASAVDNRKAAQERINAEREKQIAAQDMLQKQLAGASEEKRQEILTKLAEQKKKFEETMSEIAKRIREDERQRRANAAADAKRK